MYCFYILLQLQSSCYCFFLLNVSYILSTCCTSDFLIIVLLVILITMESPISLIKILLSHVNSASKNFFFTSSLQLRSELKPSRLTTCSIRASTNYATVPLDLRRYSPSFLTFSDIKRVKNRTRALIQNQMNPQANISPSSLRNNTEV